MSDVIPEGTSSEEVSEVDQIIADATGGGTEDSQEIQGTETTGTENAPKIDPNWESILSDVPEEFHPHLIPKLREWDQGVQSRFEKVQQTYNPYKDLVENQVPFQHIDEAMQLRQAVLMNPRSVIEYLATQQGIKINGEQERQGQKNDEELDINDLPDGKFDIEKDPRYIALKEQVEGVTGFLTAQQQREQDQQNQAYIVSSFQTLETKYGEIPDNDKKLIAKMAIAAGDDDLIKAGSEFYDRIGKAAPLVRAGESAPPVITGNRGLPMKVEDFSKMSSEERTEKLAKLMATMSSDG